jgi:hypothetical protein
MKNVNENDMKSEALKNAIEQGNEYGYISWDGMLDLCDEDMVIGRYIIRELKKMKNAGEIEFDIDDLI